MRIHESLLSKKLRPLRQQPRHPHTPPSVTQHLGNGRERTITWTPSGSFGFPGTMSVYGHTWTYHENGYGSMRPPVGPGWHIEYAGGYVSAVVTPEGGRVEYTYKSRSYSDPTGPSGHTYVTTVIGSRTVAGRSVDPGTWTFDYSSSLNGQNVVHGPLGLRYVLRMTAPATSRPSPMHEGIEVKASPTTMSTGCASSAALARTSTATTRRGIGRSRPCQA